MATIDQNDILTAVFIHDKNHGSYTAFFRQVPESIAQGETLEEAEENLFRVLPMIMEVKDKANGEHALITGDDSACLIQKSYNFQHA